MSAVTAGSAAIYMGATGAALARDLRKLVDGSVDRGFDVRYAVQCINVNACNVRLFPQPPLHQLNTRCAGLASDCDAEGFHLVAGPRSV
jgi:hypothetical protein